jgi:hypothetical protein
MVGTKKVQLPVLVEKDEDGFLDTIQEFSYHVVSAEI